VPEQLAALLAALLADTVLEVRNPYHNPNPKP